MSRKIDIPAPSNKEEISSLFFNSWTLVLTELSNDFGPVRPFGHLPACLLVPLFATQNLRNLSSVFSDFLHEVRES